MIGESDPDGCAACQGPQLGYRNGTMYSSYTAASFARKHDLADRHGVNLEGALTWAFEFEDQPYFAGFRVLASNGIDLPVLNVFRMFSLMGGAAPRGRRARARSALDAILKDGVRGAPDVSALASLDGDTTLRPRLALPRRRRARPGRRGHARPERPARRRTARSCCTTTGSTSSTATRSRRGSGWVRPRRPTPDQYAELSRSGQLALLDSPEWIRADGGQLTLRVSLPRQAVSLLRLDLRDAADAEPNGR